MNQGSIPNQAACWNSRSRGTIFFKSLMKRSISALRVSESGERKMDDGCTVAITWGASGDFTNAPRSRETLNSLPSSDCAAVAPKQTNTLGCT